MNTAGRQQVGHRLGDRPADQRLWRKCRKSSRLGLWVCAGQRFLVAEKLTSVFEIQHQNLPCHI